MGLEQMDSRDEDNVGMSLADSDDDEEEVEEVEVGAGMIDVSDALFEEYGNNNINNDSLSVSQGSSGEDSNTAIAGKRNKNSKNRTKTRIACFPRLLQHLEMLRLNDSKKLVIFKRLRYLETHFTGISQHLSCSVEEITDEAVFEYLLLDFMGE